MAESADKPPETATASPSAAPREDAPPAAAGDPLAAARKEAADHYDRYLRAVADLENYRRRALREREETRLYSAGRILEDLLPVLDHLALAIAAARQPGSEMKAVVDGVDLVLQQFKSALAAHGLTEINPAGVPFDPHRHEALSHQPSSEVPAEHVLTVVRPGYLLHQRLLRPAAVIVSGGPAPAAGEPKQG